LLSKGAISADFLAAGVLLAAVALLAARRQGGAEPEEPGPTGRYRAAFGAGILLLLGGVAMYLPMDAIAGRYTMPAVWGLDLMLAVLLTELSRLRASRWTLAAWAALAAGVLVVAVSNVGRQQKFQARARMLWEALEWVERHAPRDAAVAWVSGDSLRGGLNVEEGIHFQWHLDARRRARVHVGLCDEQGQPLERREVAALDHKPDFLIWGNDGPCPAAREVHQRFVAPYWGGRKRYECSVSLMNSDQEGAQRAVAPR
jgi:hypothetical protein